MQALLIFLLFFFVLSILGKVPVAYGLAAGCIAGFAFSKMSLLSMAQSAYSSLDSLPYLAVLFFILGGTIMEHSGISRQLMEFVNSIAGRFRGSIGLVTVVTSAAFGVLTGSVLATISAVGKIVLPEMRRKEYGNEYSAGLLTATSILGILIPPSVPGIMYALSSGMKVSEVWLSTVGPALILAVLYGICNYWIIGRQEEKAPPITASAYFGNIGKKTREALPALLMPIIIFGGIYGGFCTPTEAGAVSVVYGFAYYLVMKLRKAPGITSNVREIIISSSITTATIALLIVFAGTTSRVIAKAGASTALTTFVMEHAGGKWGFLIIVNILFLFVGTFLDINAAVLILIPLLTSTVDALGISQTHFAAISLLNLCIGFMTPPFASALFLGVKICDSNFAGTVKRMLPFLACGLITLVLVTIFPQIAEFFPKLLGGAAA